jgi:GT2 family glycosyltransferase
MSLDAQIRHRLGPVPQARDWPLVSIVVLNRDGVELLRRLLAGLLQRTDYPWLELILVDNGSRDGSLDFIRRVEAPFPISIVSNPHNESFSDGCNQGAALASGELLLFLNNDTEPFEPGWLRELVACLRASEAGAVAATLVCADDEHAAGFRYGYGVQHRGLAFREEDGMIHPVLHGWEADPLDERLGEDLERGALAAACLLVEREAYERVGGFSHGYVYGAEDVDICLKLREAGYRVLCSGRSVVIHHPVTTRRRAPLEEERSRKLGNRRLLWERWGPRLRREYELDRLPGSPYTRREVEALGFCLHDARPVADANLGGLAAKLRNAGHRSLLLQGASAEDMTGLNYDVAVYIAGGIRYVPKPGQLNMLWLADPAKSPPAIECSRYDLVLDDIADLATAAENLARETGYRTRVEPQTSLTA